MKYGKVEITGKMQVSVKGFITREHEEKGRYDCQQMMREQLAKQITEFLLANPNFYETKPLNIQGVHLGTEFSCEVMLMTPHDFYKMVKDIEHSLLMRNDSISMIIGGISHG